MLKSKIHRARVTDANLNYEGSITIYKDLMKFANIHEFEKVAVVNINNGQRFETYVIKGEDEYNSICLNGAAARLVSIGDKIIIMTYVHIEETIVAEHKPTIVMVDDKNRIIDNVTNRTPTDTSELLESYDYDWQKKIY